MFNFKVFERTERKELGTIASIVGKGGKIGLVQSNFNDESKRVLVVLTNKKGESDRALCSPQVSKLLRAKELKLSQLVGFPIIETTAQTGETINTIAMPATAMHEISLDKLKVEEFEPVAVNWEELVAF